MSLCYQLANSVNLTRRHSYLCLKGYFSPKLTEAEKSQPATREKHSQPTLLTLLDQLQM